MTVRLPRRAVLMLGLGAAIGRPAFAAESASPHIGVVSLINPRSISFYAAFDERLRALGYVDGRNLAIDFVWLRGAIDRFPGEMVDLVRRRVAVIVVGGPEAGLKAAAHATHSIPIVAVAVDYDLLAKGYAASLAHPGGNVTGVVFRNVELVEKRLDLLKQAVGHIARVILLHDAIGADEVDPVRSAASALGVTLASVELKAPPYDYEAALAGADGGRGDVLMLTTSPYFFADRARIAEAALHHRLPSIAAARGSAEAGYLMSYGPSLSGMFRLAADYVDRILKGANPADLPVQQPTKFELVVNLKAARALGLTVPQPILAGADEVIE